MYHSPTRPRLGQTLVEYGLLLLLIAILVIGAVTLLGGNITASFSSVDSSLNNTPGGGGGGGSSNPAEFVVTTPTPSAGSPVEFDGPDSASNWDWDFGDGSGSDTVEDPAYTYSTPGIYTVTLTTNEDTYTLAIEVGEPAGPPTANFDFNPPRPTQTDPMLTNCSWGGCDSGSDLVFHRALVGSSMNFTNLSSGVIDTYTWEYRENGGPWTLFSTDEEPTWTLPNHANVSVRLSVEGPGGTDMSDGEYGAGTGLYLGEVRGPLEGVIGDWDYNDAATELPNGHTKPSSGYWKLYFLPSGNWASTSYSQSVDCVFNYGNGHTVSANNNNMFAPGVTTPNYRYPTPGTYLVTVNCTDWTGTTASDTVSVTQTP